MKDMKRDIRETAFYREAEELYRKFRQPGTGRVTYVTEVNASPDGRYVVFSGSVTEKLEGTAKTRIGRAELGSGDMRMLTFGPNSDRLPKYSPDGRNIAFLSDRHKAGDFQLHLFDPATDAARPIPIATGWVESLNWSPDGKRILLVVAGHGADVSGSQGAVTSKREAAVNASWMPTVESRSEGFRWRTAWIYDVSKDGTTQLSPPGINVWEANWCGNDRVVAVASAAPEEGAWYGARLCLIDCNASRSIREIYHPADQIGRVAASPTGKQIAIVEAVCSDRGVIAGDLLLISDAGHSQRIDTAGIDVTHTEWPSEQRLLIAGHRRFETVIGLYDSDRESLKEIWHSDQLTTSGRYATVSGVGEDGDCVLSAESFLRASEIAAIRGGTYRPARSFNYCGIGDAEAAPIVEQVSWLAPDGLEIQGWLLRPRSPGPYPIVMNVHGGPVFHSRPLWLGRASILTLMLLTHGYAIFLPNPRGSSGRGQEFARHVLGDMGGADTYDCLSGLDFLVAKCIADPNRLGVMGGSYGGFMTSWLITQDSRFGAAVTVNPHTNQVSEHLIGNIPDFVERFLKERYDVPGGKYFQRSSVMHAHRAKTPTLTICGALDRCTPPAEAVQFHNALKENGVQSVLAVYPEEGHGVVKLPAAIDYAARVVAWFEEFLGGKAA